MTPDNISTGEIRTEKETAGTILTEERDSGLEIEVEQGTEGEETSRQMIDGKEIRPGTQILATQECNKNTDSPVGYTSLLNGARGKQTLGAGGGWKRTGGIRDSGISHDHHRRDTPGRGK